MVKKFAVTAGFVVATLIVLHMIAPASIKAYTGTT